MTGTAPLPGEVQDFDRRFREDPQDDTWRGRKRWVNLGEGRELEAKREGGTVPLSSRRTRGNGVSTGHPLFWRRVERESMSLYILMVSGWHDWDGNLRSSWDTAVGPAFIIQAPPSCLGVRSCSPACPENAAKPLRSERARIQRKLNGTRGIWIADSITLGQRMYFIWQIVLFKVFGQHPERLPKFNKFIKLGMSLETALKAPMSWGGWPGRPLRHREPTPYRGRWPKSRRSRKRKQKGWGKSIFHSWHPVSCWSPASTRGTSIVQSYQSNRNFKKQPCSSHGWQSRILQCVEQNVSKIGRGTNTHGPAPLWTSPPAVTEPRAACAAYWWLNEEHSLSAGGRMSSSPDGWRQPAYAACFCRRLSVSSS